MGGGSPITFWLLGTAVLETAFISRPCIILLRQEPSFFQMLCECDDQFVSTMTIYFVSAMTRYFVRAVTISFPLLPYLFQFQSVRGSTLCHLSIKQTNACTSSLRCRLGVN